MICFCFIPGCRKLSAKGVTKAAQKLLTHELYKSTLVTAKPYPAISNRITSENHILKTVSENKVSLSEYDNKRYILADGLRILPFGHYSIRNSSQSTAESDTDSYSWFDNENEDSEISWDYKSVSEENLSRIFNGRGNAAHVDWDYRTPPSPIPPPAKRMRKHLSDHMNQMLNIAENWTPPDPEMIVNRATTEEEISDSDVVDFDRCSSSEGDHFQCSLINFEASDSSD